MKNFFKFVLVVTLLQPFNMFVFAAGDGSVSSTVEINSTTANGPVLLNGVRYGSTVVNIGDLDDDGVVDIAVTTRFAAGSGSMQGEVNISFLNIDGTVKSTVKIDGSTENGPTISDGDQFGSGMANIGDLDGDGVQDLAIGALGDDFGGADRGTVHILFMNTNGSVKSTVEINSSTVNGPVIENLDYFGVEIDGLGDLDGDGVLDIAVSSFLDDAGGLNRGTVHILFMNTNGSVKSTVEINSNTANGPVLNDSDSFGVDLENIGDLDGDGVIDLAVGSTGDDAGGSNKGAVHILFMNTNGSVKSTVEINSSTLNGPQSISSGGYFGNGIANIGDLDGDGVQDLAIGEQLGDVGGSDRGLVHILFMNTDGSVKSTVQINSNTANGPVLNNGDYYGVSVDNLGDLDGNGVNDLIVGAWKDDAGGADRGTVHIHYMNFESADPGTFGGATKRHLTASCSVSDRTIEVGDDVTFEVSIDTSEGDYDFKWIKVLEGDDEEVEHTFDTAGTFHPRGLASAERAGEEVVNCGTITVSEEKSSSVSNNDKDLTEEETLITTTTPTSPLSEIISKYKDFLLTLRSLGITLSDEVNKILSDETPSSTSSPTTTFTRDLELGDSHPQVKLLQQFLNSKGYTVAQTGPGSKGGETEMFGHATQAALIRFQVANSISPSVGYFGAVTRAVVNGL